MKHASSSRVAGLLGRVVVDRDVKRSGHCADHVEVFYVDCLRSGRRYVSTVAGQQQLNRRDGKLEHP